MSDIIEFTGTNVDEAIENALKKMGVARDEVEVEVVEEPSKGLLGLGAKEAKVKVRLKSNLARKSPEAMVGEILSLMGIGARVDAEESAGVYYINIYGENLGMLIGRHGHTLDALQYLINVGANKNNPSPKRIIIDVEGYRQQRSKEIKALAERMVGKVIARHEAITLRPMNAYERKIVHLVVGEYSGVESSSTGEEPERHVVISPTES